MDDTYTRMWAENEERIRTVSQCETPALAREIGKIASLLKFDGDLNLKFKLLGSTAQSKN